MLAVRGAKSTVCIWDVSHGTLISELRVERGLTPASLAFSPDGSLLITGLWRLETEWNGEVVDVSSSYDSIVWDWEWGAPLAQLPGFGSDVVFSRDGSRLAIAGDHGVQVWATHKT